MATAANRHVFLEISIGGEVKGRIVLELFDREAPKTAENFHALCTGEKGGKLHFKGSLFTSVIPSFMCHGGDGVGSIYGANFPLEHNLNGHRSFDRAFQLCTALMMPDKDRPFACGSGFFITTGPTPWLQGHTIFGRVVDGSDVVKAMEEVGTRSGITTREVKISDCGAVARSPTPQTPKGP